MPNLAPVVLNDSSAVAVTFQPLNIKDGIASLATRVETKPVLETTMKLSQRAQSNGAFRINAKMTIPVTELDANAQEQVLDSLIVDVSIRVPDSSSLVARQDARAYLGNLSSDAVFIALVDNLEGMY